VIAIRPLDLGDRATLEALVRVQRASYGVEAELIGFDDLPPLRETPEQLAAVEESFLGAFEGERLLGAVAFRRHATWVDIYRLVVDPSAFRRGVATRLLDTLDAQHPDAAWTTVATGEANAPAIALYERRGFRAVGRSAVAPGIRIVRFERRNAVAGDRAS
jgi:ribosomal protein S18 acetylase RimI-like enzyme